jgi:hypothetical protein
MAVRRIRERDIRRVIKAARGAGLELAGVEVDPHTGKITVLAGRSIAAVPAPTPLEAWKAKRDARPA